MPQMKVKDNGKCDDKCPESTAGNTFQDAESSEGAKVTKLKLPSVQAQITGDIHINGDRQKFTWGPEFVPPILQIDNNMVKSCYICRTYCSLTHKNISFFSVNIFASFYSEYLLLRHFRQCERVRRNYNKFS